MTSFIQSALSRFLERPIELTAVISPPAFPHQWAASPGVLIWHPISSYDKSLHCPECSKEHLLHDGRFTSDKRTKYRPRNVNHPICIQYNTTHFCKDQSCL
jgi:hypothetical protein